MRGGGGCFIFLVTTVLSKIPGWSQSAMPSLTFSLPVRQVHGGHAAPTQPLQQYPVAVQETWFYNPPERTQSPTRWEFRCSFAETLGKFHGLLNWWTAQLKTVCCMTVTPVCEQATAIGINIARCLTGVNDDKRYCVMSAVKGIERKLLTEMSVITEQIMVQQVVPLREPLWHLCPTLSRRPVHTDSTASLVACVRAAVESRVNPLEHQTGFHVSFISNGNVCTTPGIWSHLLLTAKWEPPYHWKSLLTPNWGCTGTPQLSSWEQERTHGGVGCRRRSEHVGDICLQGFLPERPCTWLMLWNGLF